MAITLKQLIRACPFREDLKEKLLAKADSFSEEEKLRLSATCWTALAQLFDLQLKRMRLDALEKIANREKKFNQQDFAEMEVKLQLEFSEKLRAAGTEVELSEVRQKLQEHLPLKK